MKLQKKLMPLHETSMRILSEIGMRFHHSAALGLFQDHGFRVEKEVVRFDPDLLMAKVANAPSCFRLYALNKTHDVVIGGQNTEFAPCYGASFIVSPEGDRRNGTMADYLTLLRLVHQSDLFHINGGILVQPSDVPPQAVLPVMTLASLFNSDKCLFSANGDRQTTDIHFSLLEQVFGGRNSMARNPRTFTIINTISPLQIDAQSVETLLAYAERKQPVVVSPTVMAGTTGPVTLAGTLALANAEALAVICLAQLVSPGTPVVYGCQAAPADMRTAQISIGSPSRSLCIQTGAALAKAYRLPYRSGGCDTDEYLIDARCGSETMMAMMATCLSDTHLVIHAAGIMGSYGAVSPEKMVFDMATIQRIRSLQNGIDISEDHLAFEVIKQVGIGGEYLTSPHTLKYCRNSDLQSELFKRTPSGKGKTDDLIQQIQQEIEKQLSRFSPPDLSPSLKLELMRLVKKNCPTLKPQWLGLESDTLEEQ